MARAMIISGGSGAAGRAGPAKPVG